MTCIRCDTPLSSVDEEKYNSLTVAERKAVFLVLQGYSNDEIAKSLELSSQTVKNCLRYVYKKLKLKSRAKLIVYILRRPAFERMF